MGIKEENRLKLGKKKHERGERMHPMTEARLSGNEKLPSCYAKKKKNRDNSKLFVFMTTWRHEK